PVAHAGDHGDAIVRRGEGGDLAGRRECQRLPCLPRAHVARRDRARLRGREQDATLVGEGERRDGTSVAAERGLLRRIAERPALDRAVVTPADERLVVEVEERERPAAVVDEPAQLPLPAREGRELVEPDLALRVGRG